jgi:hypothetical protein
LSQTKSSPPVAYAGFCTGKYVRSQNGISWLRFFSRVDVKRETKRRLAGMVRGSKNNFVVYRVSKHQPSNPTRIAIRLIPVTGRDGRRGGFIILMSGYHIKGW